MWISTCVEVQYDIFSPRNTCLCLPILKEEIGRWYPITLPFSGWLKEFENEQHKNCSDSMGASLWIPLQLYGICMYVQVFVNCQKWEHAPMKPRTWVKGSSYTKFRLGHNTYKIVDQQLLLQQFLIVIINFHQFFNSWRIFIAPPKLLFKTIS